jgi:hypothetical protein
MQNFAFLYCTCTDPYPCFYRIRGDQQHFVRRDELKVCATLHICALLLDPSSAITLFVSVLLTPGSFICKNSFISVLLHPLTLHLSLFQAAWQIFTPLLHDIDDGKLKALRYEPGSRGPKEADELSARVGYVQTHGYVWVPPTLA